MLNMPPLSVSYIFQRISHVRRREYLTFDFTDMKISCHVFQFLGSCHVHSFEDYMHSDVCMDIRVLGKIICIVMSGWIYMF